MATQQHLIHDIGVVCYLLDESGLTYYYIYTEHPDKDESIEDELVELTERAHNLSNDCQNFLHVNPQDIIRRFTDLMDGYDRIMNILIPSSPEYRVFYDAYIEAKKIIRRPLDAVLYNELHSRVANNRRTRVNRQQQFLTLRRAHPKPITSTRRRPRRRTQGGRRKKHRTPIYGRRVR
jgi:hypothetical protein